MWTESVAVRVYVHVSVEEVGWTRYRSMNPHGMGEWGAEWNPQNYCLVYLLRCMRWGWFVAAGRGRGRSEKEGRSEGIGREGKSERVGRREGEGGREGGREGGTERRVKREGEMEESSLMKSTFSKAGLSVINVASLSGLLGMTGAETSKWPMATLFSGMGKSG